MANPKEETPGSGRRGLSRSGRICLGVAALAFYSAGLLVIAAYISFKAPIKPDRYGHAFSSHVGDRLTAYALWFKSASKKENAFVTIEKIDVTLAEASTRYGVDPCLVRAVAIYESSLNPGAISTTGAVGLMALQPHIARQLSLQDPFDLYSNADGGARLLKRLSQEFNGNLDLVLAGYNAGSDAVNQYHGVPPYRETIDYVKNVGRIHKLCSAGL